MSENDQLIANRSAHLCHPLESWGLVPIGWVARANSNNDGGHARRSARTSVLAGGRRCACLRPSTFYDGVILDECRARNRPETQPQSFDAVSSAKGSSLRASGDHATPDRRRPQAASAPGIPPLDDDVAQLPGGTFRLMRRLPQLLASP